MTPIQVNYKLSLKTTIKHEKKSVAYNNVKQQFHYIITV